MNSKELHESWVRCIRRAYLFCQSLNDRLLAEYANDKEHFAKVAESVADRDRGMLTMIEQIEWYTGEKILGEKEKEEVLG
jgi:hypothetical protein